MEGLIPIVLIISAVALGLFLVGIALVIIAGGIATAGSLFEWAAESGFVGVALYVVVWVIATPFMLVVCLVGGAIRAFGWWATWTNDRHERRARQRAERQAGQGAI
jgi:hypothetical protein